MTTLPPISDTRLSIRSVFGGVFFGRRVLVTGDTGFKGSWLCEWLRLLGAEVTGFALAPAGQPALFDELGLAKRIRHVDGDVRDLAAVRRVLKDSRPEFVFHLAAQALVRRSYTEPIETYATNVMGTAHVLEALRLLASPVVAVMITTDKCYENREWVHGYRETDTMGGHDPYSSSKGAAELVIAAYRQSYFSNELRVRVASARAGNVIGGGDWADDRIVPDCIRALLRSEAIPVRNKIATRPWQHVLEPLSGYLWLAACLDNPRLAPLSAGVSDSQLATLSSQLCSPFNFGPELNSNRTVAELVQVVLRHWPGQWQDRSDPNAVHEAGRLSLSIDKAHHHLGWAPVWDFEATLRQTVTWYREVTSDVARAPELTRAQINDYVAAGRHANVTWATPASVHSLS